MRLTDLLAGLAILVPFSLADKEGYFLCEEGLDYCGHTLSTMGESCGPSRGHHSTNFRTQLTPISQTRILFITAQTNELDLQMSSKLRFAQMDVSMQVGGNRTIVGEILMSEGPGLC